MTPSRKAAADGLDVPRVGRLDPHHQGRDADVWPPFEPARVNLEPGISLVEASAGTGKTFCITLTVLRLLLDRDASGQHRVGDIGKILVVTFTNAATDELVTRIRRTIREAVDVFGGVETTREPRNEGLFRLLDRYGAGEEPRLREALAMLDRLSVFTIHGFCQRVLQESALESGTPFDAGFLEDDALLVERVAQDWWRRTVYDDPRLAALAVHNEWRHDAFLARDYKDRYRWPDALVEPCEPLADAMRALDDAIVRFASAWDVVRAADWLAGHAWRKNAPLAATDFRERVVRAGTALGAGDLGAGLLALEHCTIDAIRDEKAGIKQKPADRFEQVEAEPFVRAIEGIAAVVGRVLCALRVNCLDQVRRGFDAEKKRRHLLGFDDLLQDLQRSLEDEGPDGHLATAIRKRYDAALIDEFQDTDPYQFPIFSTAFAGRPLFLIGDPKQAIYGFRGADVFAYMDAVAAADRHYTLRGNWRSTPRMVGAVNALFSRRPAPFLYEQIPFLSVKAARTPADLPDPLVPDGLGAMHWWYVPPDVDAKGTTKPVPKGTAQHRLHTATVREIVRLVRAASDGGLAIAPGRIAVLVRTGFEGASVQRALRAAGVPSIVAGMGDILQSEELAELERILRAVTAPQDARAVRAALVTTLWGIDAAGLLRLATAEHEREWDRLTDRLCAARDAWVRHGFMRMVQELLADLAIAERLLAAEDGERRLTNLRHAIELLHATSIEERLSPEGLLLWIGRARARRSEDAERTELRLESDADAVQVVTIHKSKGLEYDVVFCPGLWEARRTPAGEPVVVHHRGGEGADTVVFDHGSPMREERGRLADAERLAEDLRLAYVALTRARFRCYVGWAAAENKGKRVGAESSALAWLLRDLHGSGDAAFLTESAGQSMFACMGDWGTMLEATVAASKGTMTSEVLAADVAPAERWKGGEIATPDARPRAPLPALSQMETWRVSSFTSLTAQRHVATDDARDVSDEGAEVPAMDDAEPVAPRHDDFMDFPKGRRAGVALHELFERAAFDATPAVLLPLVTGVLQRERFATHAGDPRIDATIGMMGRVLGAPLPVAGFALRDVPVARTLREWKFDLPMGAVEPATLSTLFAAHGGDVARAYAPALRALAPRRAQGFLTGVVDLAFEHEGRWYLVDWKSNHLGREGSQYERAGLEAEMTGSHYTLQYHLYVTALHRFLRSRVPGYTYETHMGGTFYAFLRGIGGGGVPAQQGRGWWHDRPPVALVQALDRLMEAGVEATA